LLNRIRRRWLMVATLRASGLVLFVAALIGAAAALADRWLQPSDGALMALALLAGALPLVVVALCAWPLRKTPDDRRMARFIEERCPELDDELVTAGGGLKDASARRPFAPLVVAGAARRLSAVELARVVDPSEIRLMGAFA